MKKKIFLIFSILIIYIIVDRFAFMPKRLTINTWLHESGPTLGEPIKYDWDFLLNNNELIFKTTTYGDYEVINRNRQSKFYFIGCYFGNLYIVDSNKNKLIIYSKKG